MLAKHCHVLMSQHQKLSFSWLVHSFSVDVMAMTMMKQMMARKAEKALKEILDKADSNFNGKVELKDFTQILEANGVEVGVGNYLI